MGEYRKKPIVVEALRLPTPGEENQKVADLFDFLDGAEWEIGMDGLSIKTREGVMLASPGDWIIKGVAGEFYPCKPDIFAMIYEDARKAPSAGDPKQIAESANCLSAAIDEEREAIVKWLRDDAGKTRDDLMRLHANRRLTTSQTEQWEDLISLEIGIAAAIERGDHINRETRRG